MKRNNKFNPGLSENWQQAYSGSIRELTTGLLLVYQRTDNRLTSGLSQNWEQAYSRSIRELTTGLLEVFHRTDNRLTLGLSENLKEAYSRSFGNVLQWHNRTWNIQRAKSYLIHLNSKFRFQEVSRRNLKDKVNHQSVKNALNKMKAMASDAVFDFSSDCWIKACNKFIDHVTTSLKSFLATGKISAFLLLCMHISANCEGQLRWHCYQWQLQNNCF